MSDLIYIPVSDLYPHPDNPRTELGDLTELADSIKAKGILQNLTVIHGHYVSEETWKTVPEAERLSTVGELRLYGHHQSPAAGCGQKYQARYRTLRHSGDDPAGTGTDHAVGKHAAPGPQDL